MIESRDKAAKLIGAQDYATRYLADMVFENHLIVARQDRCLDFLMTYRPATVLEVGCGPDLLIERFSVTGTAIRQWMVVEPSFYADAIADKMAGCDWLGLTRGYLEDQVDVLRGAVPGGYDAVLLSGLLHETTSPATMLTAAYDLLGEGGHVFVSVPNARSFHRLLAVEMGLMQAETDLSARNRELGQPIVYSRETLEPLVREVGFEIVDFSGYMFKPFSNGQMGQVIDAIGSDVVAGLNRLGMAFPDHAAEIAVVARKGRATEN